MPATLTRPKTATKKKQTEEVSWEELQNITKKLMKEGNLKPYTKNNKNIMAYTITITSNSPQALAFVKEAEKLDFAIVTKTKVTKEKVPAKAKTKAGLKKPAPTFEEETKESSEGV